MIRLSKRDNFEEKYDKDNKIFLQNLSKQRELLYKYDNQKKIYNVNNETIDKLKYDIIFLNKSIIKHMMYRIKNWLRVHERGNGYDWAINFSNNEDAFLELKDSLRSNDIEKQRIAIEKSLMLIHGGGPMLDYYGITKEEMDYLSNMPTENWDRQTPFANLNKKHIKLSFRQKNSEYGRKILYNINYIEDFLKEAQKNYNDMTSHHPDNWRIEMNYKSIVQTYKFYVDFYYKSEENRKYMEDVFNQMSSVANSVLDKLKQVPYIDEKNLKKDLLFRETDMGLGMVRDMNNIYPIIVYVSAGDRNTIGLKLDENGKFSMFEGNDEASMETLNLVNKLTEEDREIRLYASHDFDVVEKIRETNTLPSNLFLSPNKPHAQSYWGKKRQLFSCLVNLKYINQTSEIDWQTTSEVKIRGFRYE